MFCFEACQKRLLGQWHLGSEGVSHACLLELLLLHFLKHCCQELLPEVLFGNVALGRKG